MLRTEVLSGPDSFAKLAGSWQELVGSSPTATPFQTWEWQSTWWRCFGKGKRPRLIALYEGEDMVGLMPFSVSAGPWRTLRASGGGPSDYLHPLARAGYEQSVADSLADYLQSVKGVDLIDLHQVREDCRLAAAYRAEEAVSQACCLVLDLPPSYETYLGMLSKSLRYDVRRMDKEAFKAGKAKLVGFGEHDLGRGLDWLFETHRKRWRKRGLPGAFLGRLEAFHRDWAVQALNNGWLWLSALTVDEEPVGAIYAMTIGSACYYYQAGFDPSRSSISPGTLLVAHTLRRAIEEGKTQFDFLRGDEPYKRRWKPQRVLTNYRLLSARTPTGQIGLRWNGVGNRVESRVRARLEGRGIV